jgi:hypothetical protein
MKAAFAWMGLLGGTAASAQSEHDPVPYTTSGVANCALPGTTAEFAFDGAGRAKLVSSSSNYAGFREAARHKTWTVSTVNKEGMRLLILDNEAKSRIMVELPNGNGMAFLADGGVSDIICQVLVSP